MGTFIVIDSNGFLLSPVYFYPTWKFEISFLWSTISNLIFFILKILFSHLKHLPNAIKHFRCSLIYIDSIHHPFIKREATSNMWFILDSCLTFFKWRFKVYLYVDVFNHCRHCEIAISILLHEWEKQNNKNTELGGKSEQGKSIKIKINQTLSFNRKSEKLLSSSGLGTGIFWRTYWIKPAFIDGVQLPGFWQLFIISLYYETYITTV